MAAFKHILVPVDFGQSSARAVELALDLATKFEADLTLLHVWEIPAYAYMEAAALSLDYATPVAEAAQAELDKLLATVKARVPRAKATLLMGIPWQGVMSAIKELGPDLVVMGTHGRRGLSHALLGSVAEKVVRLSSVPVLTVREP
jgi:nucleotide-binding universal stress UspA family protein